MDVNSINNSIGNLGSVSQQNLGKTGSAQGTNEIVKDEALNLTISQVYQQKRDELSQNLQSLNEGMAFTGIAKKGLEKQAVSLENIQQELYKVDTTNPNHNPTDIKNNLAVHLQEFNDIAENTTFKNDQILLKDFQSKEFNISTSNDNHTLEQTNTKNVSTKLIESINKNPLTAKEDVTNALDSVQTSLEEVAQLHGNYSKQEKEIEQSARQNITDSINLSRENARIRTVDFGQETADFSKTNVTSNVGHLVASQANIVQEQSVRLLSK